MQNIIAGQINLYHRWITHLEVQDRAQDNQTTTAEVQRNHIASHPDPI